MRKSAESKARSQATLWNYVKMLFKIRLPWLHLGLMLLSSVLLIVCSSNLAYVTADILSENGEFAMGVLVKFAAVMLLLGLFSAANSVFGSMATEFINRNLRQLMWKKVMGLPQSSYGADRGEDLVSRITADCDYASSLITVVVSIVTGIAGCFSYVAQMYALNVTLSNVVIFMLPLSLVLGWIYGKLRFLTAQKTQGTLADTTAYLIERANGMPLIKVSGTAQQEQKNGDRCFQEQYDVEIKVGWLNVFNVLYNSGLASLGQLLPFVVGAGLVAAGVLDIPTILAFYVLSMTTGTYFANLVSEFGSIRNGLGALSRVMEIVYAPVEDTAAGDSMDVPDEDIRFENVTFGYAEEPVLQGLNVLIPKNRVTAVVGANGSGKTTLFRLLERLYDPQGGAIYFGEKNVKEYRLGEWRRAFATVSQDCPILEGTIRENITYGCRRDVSEEELERAARMANIYELVKSLPEGFDSPVAAGGSNFSGGQRQCIAIARAIMSNPDYLLLDEATSNLDARSAAAVTEALQNLMKGRTTVIIAHNLNAIRYADNVIVLQNGQVTATGTPDQVIQVSEAYRDLALGRRGTA